MRRRQLLIAALVTLAAGWLWLSPRSHVAAQSLPTSISDKDFWGLVVGLSEPGGYFRSDNLISNELAFQRIIPELQKTKNAGAYVGVGPDQNFTYITALKPKMAFIVDIRRQNLLLHLMYKALVEMSTDRIDFLSRLFSRPRPEGVNAASTLQAVFDAFESTTGDEARQQNTLQAIFDHLQRTHGFPLTDEDRNAIKFVHTSFYLGGPDIRYSFPRTDAGSTQWFPTYAELMVQTDLAGENHSYIASEANFSVLREYEKNNLIVPLTGDFGGDGALRNVGRYLKDHDATVMAFYTSNVEQYLFQGDSWKKFFTNVSTMPLDEKSVFLRAYFNRSGFRFQANAVSGLQSSTLVDPIQGLLAAFGRGDIHTYYDVVSRSK
jgi:hypothetical protein